MAKRKGPVHFERPRDEEGHFLPMELWTKKEIREFEHLKREGLLANPIKKTKIKGKKRSKDLFIAPRSDEGKFLPEREWTASEKRLAKRAEEEGLTMAQQLPRDDKGRFLSPTGKKSKKKAKKAAQLPTGVDYPVAVHPQDGSSMHQGNVTVVYPPYPPPPAPSQMAAAAPQVQFIPIPMQVPQAVQQFHPVSLSEREDDSDDRQLELFSSGGMLYERDRGTGEITACVGVDQIRDELRKEHEVTRDVFTEQCRPCLTEAVTGLGRQRPDVLENPRSRHPMYYVERTFKEKVGDALGFLRDNPLVALVAAGTLFVVGFAIYKAFRGLPVPGTGVGGCGYRQWSALLPGRAALSDL